MNNKEAKYLSEYFYDWARKIGRFSIYELRDAMRTISVPRVSEFRFPCLIGASNACVRIDKTSFVPDAEIQFDITAIDKQLSKLIGEYALPYAAINNHDFDSLPQLQGLKWNLYLLTSYCWRFSRQFEHLHFFCGPHMTICGAMVRRCHRYTECYHDKAYEMMLCDVVRRASVELKNCDIDAWLRNNGWLCQSNYSTVASRIVSRLKSQSGSCHGTM